MKYIMTMLIILFIAGCAPMNTTYFSSMNEVHEVFPTKNYRSVQQVPLSDKNYGGKYKVRYNW